MEWGLSGILTKLVNSKNFGETGKVAYQVQVAKIERRSQWTSGKTTVAIPDVA
jgi:hypothetical protein